MAFCLMSAAWGGVNENSYEVLENGAGKFKIEISGCPVASANVLGVHIDDVVIEPVEIPTEKSDVRLYAPGKPHYGNITLRVGVPQGGTSTELVDWWSEAAAGKNIRKSISVICLRRDGSEGRRYEFLDCFPTRWDPGEYSPSSNVAVETLVCKMGRVELAGVAPGGGLPGKPVKPKVDPHLFIPDNMLVLLGFNVEIGGAGSGSDVDSAWETCTGGSLNIEVPDSSTGSDTFHTTTPGHKYVDTLTLRGPLTAGRKALCQWINETVSGKAWKRTVTIKEITKDGGAGKAFIYHDCFPTRYVFPAFSAAGTGNLHEEISIKPIRLELK